MTTAEVAQECGGVAPKTVARWVQSGALAYVHKLPGIRGPYMFDRAAVMKFKEQRDRRGAVRMTDAQALIGVLAVLALVPLAIACAPDSSNRRDP